MLLYFLRIIQYFLIKFCTVVLGIILMVNTFKQCPRSAGAYLGYFGGLFWHMYLFFLRSVQYFVMKFCSGVLGITLIITNTFFYLTSCPHLQGVILEYFGEYFGILCLLFENCSLCSVKCCTYILGVRFEVHCTIFFHILTILWSIREAFLGSFWAMFI